MSADEQPEAAGMPAGEDYPRRGEIYYVDLDPVVGSEQGGHRPALVIQNDVGNRYSPVVIIAAITSRPARRVRPTDVVLQPDDSGLDVTSRALLNQIRTVDKRRLRRLVGRVTPAEMAQVDEAIRISLGLVPL